MDSKQKRLCITRRIVPVIGDINTARYAEIAEIVVELLAKGAPDIVVLISTAGGEVQAGLDIYDLLSTYPGKVTGVIYRRAASMGAVILQACDERACAKHADVMIHNVTRNNVSLDVFEDTSGIKLKDLVNKLREQQHMLYEIIVSKTKRPLAEIKKACAKEENMSADQALAFGLIDKVLTREDMAKWFRFKSIVAKA